MEQEYDLFISYKSIDKEFVSKIAEAVEAADYEGRKLKVFFDEWDIKPGEDIVARIEQGLSKSRYVALVLSPEYLKADWPTAEKNAALWKDPAGRLGFVIPILYRHCTLPPLLTFRKYLNFADHSFKTELNRLLAILRGEPLPRGKYAVQPGTTMNDREIARRHMESASADDAPELIYSNLFPVTHLPPKIWSAPTEFLGFRELREYYGEEAIVPPHVFWKNRLFTFADLSKPDHPFIGVTEAFDVASESTENWLKDDEKTTRLVWLLNDCMRVRAEGARMSFDRVGKKYFFDEGVLKETSFLPYGKGRPKGLLFDYTNGGPRGYKAFRAVKLRFQVVGQHPFLTIESGWVFKTAMGQFISQRKSIVLNARFTSTQKNNPNFGEVRFWAWLLSTEKNRISLNIAGERVEISAEPATAQMPVGIYGDQSKVTPVVEPPEFSFEDEEEEQAPEADDDDE